MCRMAKRLKKYEQTHQIKIILCTNISFERCKYKLYLQDDFFYYLIGQMERWQEENDGMEGWWSFVFFLYYYDISSNRDDDVNRKFKVYFLGCNNF